MSLSFKRKLDGKLMRLASAFVTAYAVSIGIDWIFESYWNPDSISSFFVIQSFIVATLAVMVYFGFRIGWGASFLLFSAYAFNEVSSLITFWKLEEAWKLLSDVEPIAWWTVCRRVMRLFIDLGVVWLLFQSSYRMLRAESEPDLDFTAETPKSDVRL